MGGGSQAAFSSSYQFTSTFVKIHIRDVHVRYEDDISQPGHVHAAGFILKSLGKRNLFFFQNSIFTYFFLYVLVWQTFSVPQAFYFYILYSSSIFFFVHFGLANFYCSYKHFFFAFCNNLKKFSFSGFERDCKRNFK